MSISISQSVTAIGPGLLQTGFLGIGGSGPYTYTVVSNPRDAGGSIDSSTGVYTSPASSTGVDTILVTDSLSATAMSTILVGLPIQLVCDILQNQMALSNGRVYLWDQKINQPSDNSLYIAVSIDSCKPFGNIITRSFGSGLQAIQTVNMQATVGIDIISRGTDARDRKEEIIMALGSDYAESQMELNSFFVAPISSAFVNLSHLDGTAIPYRFHIETNMLYIATKQLAVPYFDTFVNPPSVVTEP